VSAFVDQYRGRFGVEPICRTLGVSASAYYERASGRLSARRLEDERLLARIRELHAANYYAYGSRRMWKALVREGEQVGRGRVERLMRINGIQGAKRRGKPWRTTIPDRQAQRRPDLVQRDFSAAGRNQLWVADFTYLRCWEGLVFFAFVVDAYSREVAGWQFAAHMRTDLVLDALRMALHLRGPGADVELVHHSDAGSQPEFKRSSQHLVREVVRDGCSRASAGDSGVAWEDVVAGPSVGGAAGGSSAFLAGDRGWALERGGCGGGGGVAGGWQPMVPRRWRDAVDLVGPAVGALSVVR